MLAMVNWADLWAAVGVIVVALGLSFGGLYQATRNWNSDTRSQIKEAVQNGTDTLAVQIASLAAVQDKQGLLIDDTRTRLAHVEGKLSAPPAPVDK